MRYRKPVPKEGEILVKYGKDEGGEDLFYCWPSNTCGMRRDTRLVMKAFEENDVFDGRSLRQELESRGYDITTLKFSIKKVNPKVNE